MKIYTVKSNVLPNIFYCPIVVIEITECSAAALRLRVISLYNVLNYYSFRYTVVSNSHSDNAFCTLKLMKGPKLGNFRFYSD